MMKCQLVLPACLLLLWTLTASVRCQDQKIEVREVSGGIKLTCKDKNISDINNKPIDGTLEYNDVNTGEYRCGGTEVKIYVKFRTCDNCIELDVPSIVGIVIGNVAATIVIGVAVYLTASQNRTGSHKKSSDRQPNVPREPSSRAPNPHYEALKPRPKDMYGVLNRK
ncbi:T-cell surface glycoprotein CD3 epsilon chain [Perca flavescens]|uniref:T-cell surface glycoprotein CD3 epsilon chain n=1 Tax=Perca flavescens TaxID=8167 RepID=UPI00106ECAF7|nr:T-cell surface glycoprotein CD3 gamma chain [Perca flavescens]XP_028430196.1 T-cell surface glycoprotein CD3 gamma chain [Perca flavescens]